MSFLKLTVGPIQENCYIYFDEDSKEAAVIDPGDEADRILDTVKNRGLTLKFILLTHGHYDHTGAVRALCEKTEAKTFAHADEEEILNNPGKSYAAFGPLVPDGFFKDGDEIEIGGKALKVIHTPGHTAGSCCFYAASDGLLFSGDTLFRESVGRHDLHTGDRNALFSSIKNKLYTLPDGTKVLPGHDVESTIGHEKTHNLFVRA